MRNLTLFLLFVGMFTWSINLNAREAAPYDALENAPPPVGCGELFISEYVEGSSVNKCIEIYNPTSSTVDLAAEGYQLKFYFNGNTSAGTTITLSGSIGAYDVYVVCDDGAAANFLAVADQVSSSSFYNGDDAVELSKAGVAVDVIGQIGVDPGSEWGSGVVSTQDNTIRRKSFVSMGDANGTDAFDPSAEWDGFAQNNADDLGRHTSDCTPVVPCTITSLTAHFLSCNDNGTTAGDDDYFIADFTVQFTSPPTTGNIELKVDGQTFSTSVGGLGTQFQFLAIPLPATGQSVEATALFTAEPACFLSATVGTAPEPCSTIDPCTELLISEYVEGSGFNKCIEIYNPTDVDVDLASYGLFLSFNGGTFENTVPLTGTVTRGDVYVICNTAATSEFLALADQTSGDLNFNGNDAVLLQNADGTIDAMGQLGNTSNYGANVTLRRKYEVQAGDNNPFDAFTTAGWDAYPSNTSWGLGYHATECQPGLPQGWSPFFIGCQDGSVAYESGTDEWTLNSACYNTLNTQDDLTFAFVPMCGNVEVVAELNSVDFPGRAGVMIRETLAANSKMAWLFQRSNFFGSFEYRTTTNGPLTLRQFPNLNRRFLKLTRQGSIIRAYTSFNGFTWNQVSQTFLSMNDCVYVGLALHSNVDGNPVSAVFSNVEVSPLGGLFGVDAPEDGLSLQNNGLDLKVNESLSTEIRLQPNPAGSFLDIVSERWVEESTVINIFDASGKRVYSDRFDRFGASMRLDLDAMNLNPGIYLLNMTHGNEVITKRFVKQ